MKKILVLTLMVLLVFSPVLAQEATEEPPTVVNPGGDVIVVDDTAEQPINQSWIILGLIALVAVAIGFWARSNNVQMDKLANSIPLPIAEALFDLAHSRTLATVETIDDDALLDLARQLGYTVVPNQRGGFDLTRP